jgi:6-phosphogluconolactonase
MSNYCMVRTALIWYAPIPAANIHLFDVTRPGLGSDGHAASLFQGTAVLAEHHRWAAAVVGVKSEARITLTYPVLESSRRAAFVVAGEEKSAIFGRFHCGDDTLPAVRLRPTGTLWLCSDAAAAGKANQ